MKTSRKRDKIGAKKTGLHIKILLRILESSHGRKVAGIPLFLTFANDYTYIVHMSDIRFEWDTAKDMENMRKHGVSFEEARAVFLDENAIRYFDPDHSEKNRSPIGGNQ